MTNNDRPQHHAQPGERGQGGNGQATPHHGLQQPGGEAALNLLAGTDVPMPANGPSYQTGGTQQDRGQKDEERMAGEGSASSPTNTSGAADPAPGKQGGQNP